MARELTGSETNSLRAVWICYATFCLTVSPISAGLAQVTPPITSSGLGTQVGAPVNLPAGKTQYDITGGTRPGNGANLFQSFGQFGVPTNNIANFLNDSGLATSNILGRVTGGNPSNIFGTIQTTGFGAANLFLMNPAGIVFGPNASLNVGGSASFTTADYLRLADGAKFTALPGSLDASISSAPVAAFGFLGSNPGAITAQGSQLSVPAGQSLAWVGGDITIGGAALGADNVQPAQVSAPGGQIYLASTKSAGEFATQTLEQGPNVNGQSFRALGTIQVSQKSVIDASGDGGGTVLIRGGRFVIDDSRVSANVTGPATGQFVGTPGQGMDIRATQDAVIQNAAVLETSVTGDFPSAVSSGGVRITADRILITGLPSSGETFGMQPFTGIKSETQGAGNAGNVSLTSTGNIEITNVVNLQTASGFNSAPTFESAGSATLASGNAGNVELTSTHGNILMTNGGLATVVTSQTLNSSGNTGKVSASAPEGDIVLDGAAIFTHTQGSGGAGQVDITAKNLAVNSGFLSQDNLGPFQPGGLTVTLSGDFTMTGFSFMLTSSAGPTGAPAANINLTAKDITVTQGSLINSSTFGPGPGGQIKMVADTLHITDGSQVASGSTIALGQIPQGDLTGPGGEIRIQGLTGPASSVLIDGTGSGIFTNTVGTGPGGNTSIAARSVTIQNGGTISADTSGTAPSATGGNIAISANQIVSLNSGGSITASSSGPANAGNITINAGAQFLSQNGAITTTASQASGGNITVQATDSIRLVNSQVSTSVQGGPDTAGGNILLDPAVVTLQNSQVTAQAVQGTGGNISIIAGTFLADPTSVVSASSQFGLSGAVNIQSPVSSLSNTLATLPQRPLQAQNLLTQRCAAQLNGQLSSLVVTGRDALPVRARRVADESHGFAGPRKA